MKNKFQHLKIQRFQKSHKEKDLKLSEDRMRENELLEKELDKIEQREKQLLSKR